MSGEGMKSNKKRKSSLDDFFTSEQKKKKETDEEKKDKEKSEIPDDKSVNWKTVTRENLNLQYAIIYDQKTADSLLKQCEEELDYNTGDLAKIQIFGKWMDIPRKQVAFGEPGLHYNFSGNSIPAKPWTPMIQGIQRYIENITGCNFNFVLVNRYKDGDDYIGEHRDDESDLVQQAPIASLTLGQCRDFKFRHADARGKSAKRNIPVVDLILEHGSLLMMNYPTNKYWYHSLPKRKKCPGVRINMTFRVMKVKK